MLQEQIISAVVHLYPPTGRSAVMVSAPNLVEVAAGDEGRPGGEAPGVVVELHHFRAMQGAGGGQHQHMVVAAVVVVVEVVAISSVANL